MTAGAAAVHASLALALALVAAPGPVAAAFAPAHTRARMDSALASSPAFRFVYGTRDPALAPLLRARALGIATRLYGADSSRVVADRDASEADVAGGPIVLLGGPGQNEWTRRLADRLPLRFTESGFTWRGTPYERPGDAIVVAWPNPLAPVRFLVLAAANSAAATAGLRAWLPGDEDWRITRQGELARSGRFAQSPAAPWRYDPALDHDREAERARFEASLVTQGGAALVVRAAPAIATAGRVRAGGDALLGRLDAMGLRAPPGAPALTLVLYASLERKGALAGDTRPEQVTAGVAHVGQVVGREAPDLWSVAAARLVTLGAAERSRFLEPAGTWLAGRFEGEPLERSVARLYDGRLLPTAADAATRDAEFRSPLVRIPARALLARAVFECASRPRAALLAMLAPVPPGTLDSLCRAARVPAPAVAARYRRLADSLAREGRRGLALARPRPWRPADGFQAGVCLAPAGSLEGGYLSDAAVREMAALRAAGAGWVALTTYGYQPEPRVPRLFGSARGGPGEETDEAVGEAAARAREIGLRVWLSPRLASRGAAGELEFATGDWPRFFAAYRELVLHWALLAERERLDGLVVGQGLASATARSPDAWRALIADVRRVYTGTLTYEAGWEEAARVPFWDALDLVAVSFGAPLADAPTRDPATLRRGADRAVASLGTLARTFRRPVLVSALGYPALAGAAAGPRGWDEHAADPQAQRACDEAALGALDRPDWLAGVLWWKWPASPDPGGPEADALSPRGRPAEALVRSSLSRWVGRPVRVPR